MSFDFDVCKVGDDSYRVSGTTGQGNSRNTTQTFTQTYLVKALDPNGDLHTGNPSEINTAIVGQAEGLPTVQKSIYYDSDSGLIHPYAVCTSKDVKRRREAPMVFDVTCSFSAKLETESLSNQVVKEPTDIAPEVTVSVSGKDRVLYQDLEDGDQSYLFEGIKEPYPAPVVTQVPLLTLTISQYESYVSYAQILDRSFKVNSTAWQGFDAGLWRLVVKNVSEVDIQTQSGTVNWAKVTYEAVLSVDGFYDENGTWQITGWKAQIPLIAPKFADVGPNNIRKFVHADTSEPYMGFINTDGTLYSGTNPKYITHTRYETLDFNSFIQAF